MLYISHCTAEPVFFTKIFLQANFEIMEMISAIAAQRSKSLSPRGGSQYVPVDIDMDAENDEEPFEFGVSSTRHQAKHKIPNTQHPIPPPPPPDTIVSSDRNNQTQQKLSINSSNSNDISTFSSCSFYKNRYNILRLIMLMITLLFICICGLYGMGQVLSLQLDDYFCETKTLQEIHQHSIENNLNQGTNEGCWTTSNNKVDQEKLFYAGSYIAYQSVWDLNITNIAKCILFLLVAVFLFIVFIVFTVETFSDCSRFWKQNWFVI